MFVVAYGLRHGWASVPENYGRLLGTFMRVTLAIKTGNREQETGKCVVAYRPRHGWANVPEKYVRLLGTFVRVTSAIKTGNWKKLGSVLPLAT